MRLPQWMISGVLLLQAGVAAGAQYPIMEKVAQKVIQKYQSLSCQELQQKKMPAATGTREMVECGMIP